MALIAGLVAQAMEFLKRHPELDGALLLSKESAAVAKSLEKYLEQAHAVELTLQPEYAATIALVEGDGKAVATVEFIMKFTAKNCSRALKPHKADKKARKELVMQAAQDDKLIQLRKALDPKRKYRDLMAELIKKSEDSIKSQVFSMTPVSFRGLVEANGLDVPRTASGAISTSKVNRDKVVKQIVHIKQSDRYLAGLSDSD
jgi:hypothetical protein